jgi:DNA-binding NarL/FixJ family response regulator
MIRVAMLDDHPAVLAGLARLIERRPEFEPVAFAESERDLYRALDRTAADVVVLDYDLARGDGLAVCQRLQDRARPPRTVLYTAYAGPSLAVAAHFAQADGLVDKSEPVRELLSVLRRVAAGERVLPAIALDLQHAAMRRLEDEDVAVASMLLAGTPLDDIAGALDLERREVRRRARRIVARTRPHRGGRSWETTWSAAERVTHA